MQSTPRGITSSFAGSQQLSESGAPYTEDIALSEVAPTSGISETPYKTEGSAVHSIAVSTFNEEEGLPPTDRGVGAWTFCAAAFTIEFLFWGPQVCVDFYHFLHF